MPVGAKLAPQRSRSFVTKAMQTADAPFFSAIAACLGLQVHNSCWIRNLELPAPYHISVKPFGPSARS